MYVLQPGTQKVGKPMIHGMSDALVDVYDRLVSFFRVVLPVLPSFFPASLSQAHSEHLLRSVELCFSMAYM